MKTKKERVGAALTVVLAVLISVLAGYFIFGPKTYRCAEHICGFRVYNGYYFQVTSASEQEYTVSSVNSVYFRLDQENSFIKSEFEKQDVNDSDDANYVLNPVQLKGPWLLTTKQGSVYFTVASLSVLEIHTYPSYMLIVTGIALTALITIVVWSVLELIRQKMLKRPKPKQLKLPIKNTANDPSKF